MAGLYPGLALLLFSGGTPPAPTAPVFFEQNLVAYLKNLNIICYPGGKVPQKISLPCYTYAFVGETPDYLLASAAGVTNKRYQIDMLSLNYIDVATMELSLRNALHGYIGVIGSYPVTSIMTNTYDAPYEPNVNGSDDGTYRRISEYQFVINEPIPTF